MEEELTKVIDRQEMLEKESEIDDSAAAEDSESIYFSISSYGADYTVDGLIKRLEKKQIVVPEFQRSYVWDINKASRFI